MNELIRTKVLTISEKNGDDGYIFIRAGQKLFYEKITAAESEWISFFYPEVENGIEKICYPAEFLFIKQMLNGFEIRPISALIIGEGADNMICINFKAKTGEIVSMDCTTIVGLTLSLLFKAHLKISPKTLESKKDSWKFCKKFVTKNAPSFDIENLKP